jgi:ABC-type methionine transport system ATPase subunit
MTVRHLQLTFPENQVTEPVIYQIVKQFDVVPSIRRANISNHVGWMVIEVSGSTDALESAIAYLEGLGIQVADASGDIVAG